jgi:HPt (histidine-containing phosphotransfer) domain-containing protein
MLVSGDMNSNVKRVYVPVSVDKKIWMSTAELMGDAFPEMLRVFQEDAGCYIAGLHIAVAHDDRQRLAELAHTLKSSAQSLGHMEMVEIAVDIGSAAYDASLHDLSEYVTRLETAFLRLCNELEHLRH